MDQFSGDDSTDGRDATDRPDATPEEEAAALALAIVSQASAIAQGDEEALDASEDNLREVVTGLSDAPLTPRQEDVVATLGAAGGSLAAGLSEALAHTKGVDTGVVLGSAAEAVLAQTQPETRTQAQAQQQRPRTQFDDERASADGAGDDAAFDAAFDDLFADSGRDDAGPTDHGDRDGVRRGDRHADGRRPDDEDRAS